MHIHMTGDRKVILTNNRKNSSTQDCICFSRIPRRYQWVCLWSTEPIKNLFVLQTSNNLSKHKNNIWEKTLIAAASCQCLSLSCLNCFRRPADVKWKCCHYSPPCLHPLVSHTGQLIHQSDHGSHMSRLDRNPDETSWKNAHSHMPLSSHDEFLWHSVLYLTGLFVTSYHCTLNKHKHHA